MTERIGILAIGHGSKLPYNKEVVTQIADYIAQKHTNVVV
ncbi:MAG: sirohydrochlorin nickelochelatase, partial [Methanosarcina flavescens]